MLIVFLLEEQSMKEVLDTLLPKILPENVMFKTIPHSGKSDLQQSIPRKLKAWNTPDTKFVIVQDQDSANCVQLKEQLVELARPAGRTVLVRIACKELEAWYWGDLGAVSEAYGKNLRGYAGKRKYRIPDQIDHPKRELQKLLPEHQQIDGARRISKYMSIEDNTSKSFQSFVSGVKKLTAG